MTRDLRARAGKHPMLASAPFEPMDERAAHAYDALISSALAEDVGEGDLTSRAIIDADARWRGAIVARAAGTVAGLGIAARTFALAADADDVATDLLIADGARVGAGTKLAVVRGGARALLAGERVALNFLGRLSGVATLTRRYVDAAAGTDAKIADTRKTTPGLRGLERYAVRAGGGVNHRFGLADAVLIKDNHIAAVGSIAEAVRRARAAVASDVVVEAECDTLDEVDEALEADVDSVLLDNMDIAAMRKAVERARGKAIVEASGGMTLARVAEAARIGVDVISVGALTHSAPALDVALDFDERR